MSTQTPRRRVGVPVAKRRGRKVSKIHSRASLHASPVASPSEYARQANALIARRYQPILARRAKVQTSDILQVGRDGVAKVDYHNPAHMRWLDD